MSFLATLFLNTLIVSGSQVTPLSSQYLDSPTSIFQPSTTRSSSSSIYSPIAVRRQRRSDPTSSYSASDSTADSTLPLSLLAAEIKLSTNFILNLQNAQAVMSTATTSSTPSSSAIAPPTSLSISDISYITAIPSYETMRIVVAPYTTRDLESIPMSTVTPRPKH